MCVCVYVFLSFLCVCAFSFLGSSGWVGVANASRFIHRIYCLCQTYPSLNGLKTFSCNCVCREGGRECLAISECCCSCFRCCRLTAVCFLLPGRILTLRHTRALERHSCSQRLSERAAQTKHKTRFFNLFHAH